MNRSSTGFKFVPKLADWVPDPEARVAWIEGDVGSKEALLDVLSRQLEFPSYFGKNCPVRVLCLL